MSYHLTDRSRDIFRQIVDEYLTTGTPVGSRTIARRLGIDLGIALSPASIRNVMQDLEELGLIASPHTSAGRVPTQSGLRMYVDGLMQIGNLTIEERQRIEAECNAANRTIQDVYDRASNTLSGLASCVAMVITPKLNKPIRQIQFVPLDSGRAIVILVMQDGVVENRVITIPAGADRSTLEQASNFLNHHLAGKTLQEMREKLMQDMRSHQSQLDHVAGQLVEQGLVVAISATDGGNIFIRGQSNLLNDVKAMENLEQARTLLTKLEEERTLLNVMDSVSSGDGVQIFIGSENQFFDQPGWSTVISPYRQDNGQIIGAIGVIGPTRINYARIVAMVDYTAQIMSRELTGSFATES
jgi:heat-inducible transcriptional repressor